tara:strand:+ start:8827 stop:9873 length:1047 start_codon:yes stop_codon:yes gene_type:complete
MIGLAPQTLIKTSAGLRSVLKLFFRDTTRSKIYGKSSVNGKPYLTEILTKYDCGKPTIEDIIEIKVKAVNSGFQFGKLIAGRDTLVHSNDSWIKISDLRPGDVVSSLHQTIMTGSYGLFMRGILAGKASIIKKGNKGILTLVNHRNKQYLSWKLKKIQNAYLDVPAPNLKGEYRFKPSFEFGCIANEPDWHAPSNMMYNYYSDLNLSLLYGDYGSFDGTRIKFNFFLRYGNNEEPAKFARSLGDVLGMAAISDNRVITLSPNSSSNFIKTILEMWLPSPVRKSVPVLSEPRKPKTWITTKYEITSVEVLSVGAPSNRKFREINGLAGIITKDGNVFAGSDGALLLVKV